MASPWRETVDTDGLPRWTRDDGAMAKRVSTLPGKVWAGCLRTADGTFVLAENPEFDSARNAMKAIDRAFAFRPEPIENDAAATPAWSRKSATEWVREDGALAVRRAFERAGQDWASSFPEGDTWQVRQHATHRSALDAMSRVEADFPYTPKEPTDDRTSPDDPA